MKGSCFPRGVGAPKPHRDIEKEILYHKNDTVVTPRVGVIAEDLFQQTLHMAGSSIVDPPGPFPQNRMITRAHHHNPESIQWVLSSETHPHFYNSVIIDGVQYNVSMYILWQRVSHRLFRLEILSLWKWERMTTPQDQRTRCQILPGVPMNSPTPSGMC